MKKLFMLIVVVLGTIAGVFSQTTFKTVSYRDLDPDSKDVFQRTAQAHPYGTLIKIDASEILDAWEVTDVPSRSGKFETQYLIVLKDSNGQTRSILTTTRPNKDECLLCKLSECGLKHGSGPEFEEKEGTGENHIISTSYTPTDDDDDIVIE